MKRKHRKYIIFILGLVILVAFTVNSYKSKGIMEYKLNPDLECIKDDWKGNLKIDGEYVNGNTKDKPLTPWDILKWKISKNPQAKEKKEDTFKLKTRKDKSFLDSEEDMIVWLGHASFFIRVNGITLLTDPVFYNLSMIERMVENVCEAEDFKNIDYLLLSHGHRDHFDKKSIKNLIPNNPTMEALIPMELNEFFDDKGIKNQQAAWYQEYKTKEGVEIFFMPAKHWNRRGLLDFNKNLWGSFVIRFNGKTIYFSGDTAYGEHFKEIGQYFKEMDYCLMSVGAYMPVHIMKDAHMSPKEALNGFNDLKGKVFVPMHFGTYDLSDEPIGEGFRFLKTQQNTQNIKMLDIGEVYKI